MHFGVLRVLNDDTVVAGMGFGKHPHDNMEIITIPLEGDLAHKDSMGNAATIKTGDVQVMSAGTGVFHSEMNPDKNNPVKLFQIWVFPDKGNVTPRYDQKTFLPEDRKNKWQEIIKPNTQQEGDAIFIHQQAWFNLIDLDANNQTNYTTKKTGNGAYVFVIEGDVEVAGEKLKRRDAIGITEYTDFNIKASLNARILVMDLPMLELEY
jgi:redox-sensitive bicupin YhaK (pirin superfamily)